MYKVGAVAGEKGYGIKHLREVSSTNEEALKMGMDCSVTALWVVADSQTAGRGRRGRKWQSLEGNLAASLIVPRIEEPRFVSLLSYLFAVSVCEVLTGLSQSLDVHVKWPNDILVQKRKVSGILVESALRVDAPPLVVCGVGVNCQEHPDDTLYPATSLRTAGITVKKEELFERLSDAVAVNLENWSDARDFSRIRMQWLTYSSQRGHFVRVQQHNGMVCGIFETIDEDGCLIVRQEDGTRKCVTYGDVS